MNIVISNFDGQRFFHGQSGYEKITIKEANGLVEIIDTYPHGYSFMTDISWEDVKEIEENDFTLEEDSQGNNYLHLSIDENYQVIDDLRYEVANYDKYRDKVNDLDHQIELQRENVRDYWEHAINIGAEYWSSYQYYQEWYADKFKDYDDDEKPRLVPEKEWQDQVDDINCTCDEIENKMRADLAKYNPKVDYEEYYFIP